MVGPLQRANPGTIIITSVARSLASPRASRTGGAARELPLKLESPSKQTRDYRTTASSCFTTYTERTGCRRIGRHATKERGLRPPSERLAFGPTNGADCSQPSPAGPEVRWVAPRTGERLLSDRRLAVTVRRSVPTCPTALKLRRVSSLSAWRDWMRGSARRGEPESRDRATIRSNSR